MTVARRRGNGEGSIYQRSSDKRWLAVITTRDPETGKVARRTASGRTQAEARQRLEVLRKKLSDGVRPTTGTMTVSQLLNRWHSDILPNQVAESAASNYRSITDKENKDRGWVTSPPRGPAGAGALHTSTHSVDRTVLDGVESLRTVRTTP